MASEDTARTLQHLALDLPFLVFQDIERSLCALAADDPDAALEIIERMDRGEGVMSTAAGAGSLAAGATCE